MDKVKIILGAILPPIGMAIGAEGCILLGSPFFPAFLLGLVGAFGGFMCSYVVIRLMGTPETDDDSEPNS